MAHVYVARVIESDKEWGPLLLRIVQLEWASKNSDGLVADRFRVTEFEYHLWDHMLGNQGGDIDLEPIAPSGRQVNQHMDGKTWVKRRSCYIVCFSSKTKMLKKTVRQKGFAK